MSSRSTSSITCIQQLSKMSTRSTSSITCIHQLSKTHPYKQNVQKLFSPFGFQFNPKP